MGKGIHRRGLEEQRVWGLDYSSGNRRRVFRDIRVEFSVFYPLVYVVKDEVGNPFKR